MKKIKEFVKALKDTTFIFRMGEDLHREVKIRAAMRNISMGAWITQAIIQRIAVEYSYEKEPGSKKD